VVQQLADQQELTRSEAAQFERECTRSERLADEWRSLVSELVARGEYHLESGDGARRSDEELRARGPELLRCGGSP
jgi:hypothetical protein